MNNLVYNGYGEIINNELSNNLIFLYYVDSDISRYNTICDCGCIVNRNLLYYHKLSSPNHTRKKNPILKKKSFPTKKITKDNIRINVSFD